MRVRGSWRHGALLAATLSAALVLTGCTSSQTSANEDAYLRALKADPLVGGIFDSGKYDDTMLEFADSACQEFANGVGIIEMSVDGAQQLGVNVEVYTQLALIAATEYCPEVQVDP